MNRSNITILEERRLIDEETINSVIRPFLISRNAPFMNLPEYENNKDVIEEPQEIIITSAHYKSSPWYPETKKFLRQAVEEEDLDIKFTFLDYFISIRHGIKTKKQMQREIAKLDPITFLMEYGNIPYGSSANSFYKLELFNRNVKRAWRPITDENFVTLKKNPYDILKDLDEQRLVSVDVAMRAGSTNDNSIISCGRLSPTRRGWSSDICYMESHNGKNTNYQALRIKQIMEEFQGDVLILDIANAGIN